jgi:hypothetical protein
MSMDSKDTIETEIKKTEENMSSSLGVKSLIKKLKLQYNKQETQEIINELGLENEDCIQIGDLVTNSKNKRIDSKYSEFYENILNKFMTPSERIIQILNETKEKLVEFGCGKLVQNLDWVINKINNNDDIYNLHFDNNSEFLNDSQPSDIENTMKLLNEYSSDDFNKNKKENIKTAKRLFAKRHIDSQTNDASPT